MKWALRTRTHKFILACQPDVYGLPARELYDLEVDPRELNNLARHCRGWLRNWKTPWKGGFGPKWRRIS
jgi:hypothetical protein